MTSEKKVLVLVPLSNKYPSKQILNSIKKTWGNNKICETVFYFGNKDEDRFIENNLELKIPNDFKNFGNKTLKCFEKILEEKEFDYIFRTNTSSYIDKQKLLNFINRQEELNYYAGKTEYFPGLNFYFCSGAGYFLSRNLVELVCKNKDGWDHNLNEDVALGHLIEKFNIKHSSLERYDIESLSDIKNLDMNYFHFRFRIDKSGYPRIFEILILKIIHLKTKNAQDPRNKISQQIVTKIFLNFLLLLLIISKIFNIMYFIKKNEKLDYWFKKYIFNKKPPWEI